MARGVQPLNHESQESTTFRGKIIGIVLDGTTVPRK